MQALVLDGGIKGWVASGDEYVKCMTGYDKQVWQDEKKVEAIGKP